MLNDKNLAGIVLYGGPNSVKNFNSPNLDNKIINLNIPILGICYGLQLICKKFKGKIGISKSREYGHSLIKIKNNSLLFKGVKKINQVWMSHGDHIEKQPNNFIVTSISNNKIISSIENKNKKIYGLQFHPEVYHSLEGKKIISNFINKICKIKKKFKINDYLSNKINELREEWGKLVLLYEKKDKEKLREGLNLNRLNFPLMMMMGFGSGMMIGNMLGMNHMMMGDFMAEVDYAYDMGYADGAGFGDGAMPAEGGDFSGDNGGYWDGAMEVGF